MRPELKAYRLVPMDARARRPGAGVVSHIAGWRGAQIHVALADGAAGPWGALGASRIRLQLPASVAGQLRLCGVVGEFPGSVGFGKAFVNAGDLQWGRKMHDDLLDAVEWAIKKGIADRRRIAIMVAPTGVMPRWRDLRSRRRCSAAGGHRRPIEPGDASGDSAALLGSLLRESRTPRGRPAYRGRPGAAAGAVAAAFGRQDHQTPADRTGRQRAASSRRADEIIEAMRAKNLAVTYVLYPQEGHGFAVPENSLSFNAIAETFLAAHLGGRCDRSGRISTAPRSRCASVLPICRGWRKH